MATNNNGPNNGAPESHDLEVLLGAPVASVLASMNLGASVENDITLLSALAYLPPNGNPFAPAAIQAATRVVNPSDPSNAAPNSSVGVNPSLIPTALSPAGPDPIFKALAPLVSGSSLPGSDALIIDYFYRAGRAAFVSLLIQQIYQVNGVQVTGDTAMAGTKDPYHDNATLTLNTLFDLLKRVIEDLMPQLDGDAFGRHVDALPDFMKQVSDSVATTVAGAVPDVDQRDFLFGKQQQDAVVALGLGPWLTLKFILAFVGSPSATFVDQIYARYAVMQAIRISLTKLSLAYDPSVSAFRDPVTGQVAIIARFLTTVLPQMIPTLTVSDFQTPILEVTDGAATASQKSQALQTLNAQLAQRLQIAGNLEVSGAAQERDLRETRRAFYAWVAAYVLVLAASSFLIATDRLSAFMALAVATLLLMAAAWAYATYRGRAAP